MKDYTLSEIKAHCKVRVAKYHNPCKGCEMEVVCKSTLPLGWEIEPRDMIELPCVNVATISPFGKEIKLYEVHYRDNKTNAILTKICKTEPEADAFLAELKGGKA